MLGVEWGKIRKLKKQKDYLSLYKSEVLLSSGQIEMFKAFNNISRLFSYNGCSFFSANLLTQKYSRSKTAHDIHMMLHQIIGTEGTIFLFRFCDEIMLSFCGFGCNCMLSDWYPQDDDYDNLLRRLDIANMSLGGNSKYFADMVYMLARKYYLYEKPDIYAILPCDFISSAGIDGIDEEKLDKLIEHELTASEREYGDDYVEYEKFAVVLGKNDTADIDLMLLDINDDNKIQDYAEVEESDFEIEDLINARPEIFRDPILMVKWLNKINK